MKRVSKKAQYQHMIDNVNDAVYTVRLADNCFTSLNPAGERMTGYTRKEFLKLTFSDLIAPEYLGLVRQMIQQKAKEDRSTIYEIEIF